jgi:hypothetical protein
MNLDVPKVACALNSLPLKREKDAHLFGRQERVIIQRASFQRAIHEFFKAAIGT